MACAGLFRGGISVMRQEQRRQVCTVTLNPSLDYMVSVENFRLGYTNRTAYECLTAGGKGINVSTVLKNLGIGNTALGFMAGFTGQEAMRQLRERGIESRFVMLHKKKTCVFS